MTGTPPIKVLLVQEERLMFEGLSSLLADSSDISVAGVASSAADAVDKVVHLGPDLVLLAGRLQDSTGPQACERIRATRQDVAVLMLSSDDSEETMERAAVAGAAGYLSPEVSVNELVGAIRKLAGGELLVTMAIMARQARDLAVAEESTNGTLELSHPERDVLALVAAGLTNAQIADQLGIATPAVRSHVRSAIEKRGVHSKTQAVDSARQAGLLPDVARSGQ